MFRDSPSKPVTQNYNLSFESFLQNVPFSAVPLWVKVGQKSAKFRAKNLLLLFTLTCFHKQHSSTLRCVNHTRPTVINQFDKVGFEGSNVSNGEVMWCSPFLPVSSFYKQIWFMFLLNKLKSNSARGFKIEWCTYNIPNFVFIEEFLDF